jgi:hypothetical protein
MSRWPHPPLRPALQQVPGLHHGGCGGCAGPVHRPHAARTYDQQAGPHSAVSYRQPGRHHRVWCTVRAAAWGLRSIFVCGPVCACVDLCGPVWAYVRAWVDLCGHMCVPVWTCVPTGLCGPVCACQVPVGGGCHTACMLILVVCAHHAVVASCRFWLLGTSFMFLVLGSFLANETAKQWHERLAWGMPPPASGDSTVGCLALPQLRVCMCVPTPLALATTVCACVFQRP